MPRDYYETLGVKRDASDEDIKRAYRSLARQHHPDRNPGDKQAETKFKEIQDAYDVLSDKSKREQYDRFGFVGPGGGMPGGGQTFHWGGGMPGGGFQEMDPAQAQELFGQFFGGGGAGGFEELFGRGRSRPSRARRAPPAPEPVTTDVTIPFVTAASGGKISVRFNGHEIEVKIPPGVKEDQRIRLAGQGPSGSDIYLKLHIAPHPYFKREGNNIILEVPVSISEAILGTKIDVPTLDGAKLSVKVPPGTSSGSRLRLRGRGVQGGDQFIETKIVAAAPADNRSKELMEEFAKLNPQNPRAGLPWE